MSTVSVFTGYILATVRIRVAFATNCNTTDILSSPCNNRATFPTHSSATTEKLGACNQQDFQRTNVYWKSSTLITNITQPSLNNPKLPHKFQRQDNNHVQIPNIHRYQHIPPANVFVGKKFLTSKKSFLKTGKIRA